MIFVTAGTTKFDELIKKIDECLEKGQIKEKVIAQIGNGAYLPKNMKYFRFSKDLTKYYKMADVVISHEGAGTLLELVNLGKKTISLENPGTVENPDILNKLSKDGYVFKCNNISKIVEAINEARRKKFRKYVSPKCFIHKVIADFVEKM
jgi:beta-1,4-N-acetylglucosaminyltransferase